MTTVLNRASQVYNPGSRSFPLSGLTSALRHFSASFTRESWPPGDVAILKITRPDGYAAEMRLSGDDLGLNKQGLPYPNVSLGIDKPAGITSMQVDVQVLQTFTTAITVDAS